MRRQVFITVATAIAVAVPAFGAKPSTLEEREAGRQAFRERIARNTGGFIARPHAAGAKFTFVNWQGLVPEAELAKPVETMARILRHDICMERPASATPPFSVAAADSLVRAQRARGAVFIVEDDALPTILTAPESGWGVVNVRRLDADSPGPLLLAQRTRREMWRAFALVNGAGNTRMGKCVLQTVLSLRDLDALGAEAFCPEPVNAITAHLNRLGIREYQSTTYRQACIEGWAPPPTNDVQRAVWEKVHSEKERGPSRGLKISP